VEAGIVPAQLQPWFEQRFVSAGYYALVEYSEVTEPQPDYTSESCGWYSLHDLPDLMLDHRVIVEKAHETLKRHLNDQPIGLNLLPPRFTMPELQALYETVLGKQLDRRNFRRKMLGYDILIRTNATRRGAPHKAPRLYEFDRQKYHRALREGLNPGW
jgi:hypothetical protein